MLGDAAVVEVMSQLFELRHEPWQQQRPARASTELEVPLELLPAAVHEDPTGPATSPSGTRLRAATEAAESQLETPPHGVPKRPSAFSIVFEAGVAKVSPTNATDGVAAVPSITEAVASLSNATDSVASLRNDTEAVTILRGDIDAAASVSNDTVAVASLSNDTDGVPVVPDPAPKPRPLQAGPSKGGPLKPLPVAPRPSPPSPSSRRGAVIGWAVFSLLAAAAVATGIYILLQGSSGSPAQASSPGAPDLPGGSGTPSGTPPGTPPPSAPPVIDAAPPRPPAPPPIKQVQLRITTTPADATVLLDGKRLGRTPYTGTIDAAPGMHALKLRRRGYLAVTLDVELSVDVTREVTLQRAKADPTPAPAPAPAPP